MVNIMTTRIKATLYYARALLPPPVESKRTLALLDKELRLSSKTPPSLGMLRGLATTIKVATFSFFNGLYYTGRSIARLSSLRPALSSFLLFSAALLYLIYSITTLGIGPYFTNRRVIDSLYFSSDLGLPSIPKKQQPLPSSEVEQPQKIEWNWTKEDKFDTNQNLSNSKELIYTGL